jgi:hypothetical protein
VTQAVSVRRDGDNFQARLFWLRAARLLDPESPIVRVGFEVGPKAFDDIWVEYDPRRSPLDQNGEPLLREHIQCKWHVAPDTYGHAHLTDPEFINANARSLLQRARSAQLTHAPAGRPGVRFKLVTNWQVDRADPLREMIGTRSGAIRVERLYGSATDNSRAGTVRKLWREHLDLDEDELRTFVSMLAFGAATDSMDDLRDQIDAVFAYVGLRRVPPQESAFSYDSTVFEWLAQKRLEFDRTTFRKAVEREGLLAKGAGRPLVYGVKSFEHSVDRLEDRCAVVLDLVPAFDERYIRSDADWAERLYPELKAFLLSAAEGAERLRLVLDAHATLAFAAGSVLNVKSGRHVEIEQRTPSRQVWSPDDVSLDERWPALGFEVIDLDPEGKNLVVAIGITHDVAADVRRYAEGHLPSVGRIIVARPSCGPGSQAVVCGRHALGLAEALVAEVRTLQMLGSVHTVHLFVAAPNAFTFMLGQRQPLLGRVRLYEFDLEGGRDRSYAPGLALPVQLGGHENSGPGSRAA